MRPWENAGAPGIYVRCRAVRLDAGVGTCSRPPLCCSSWCKRKKNTLGVLACAADRSTRGCVRKEKYTKGAIGGVYIIKETTIAAA